MTARADWTAANQTEVVAALDRVRRHLERHAERATGGPPHPAPADAAPADGDELAPAVLRRAFGLSEFERDVVLLCAGVELDARFASLVAAAHGDPQRRAPTFGLALAALPGAHWSALTPGAPLRAFRLVETTPGAGVSSSPLRIDERVLHFLAGIDGLDERLHGIAEPIESSTAVRPQHAAEVDRVLFGLADSTCRHVVQITGADVESRTAVAARAASVLGAKLLRVRSADLPAAAAERFALARLLCRETRLSRTLTLLEAAADADGARIAAFAESLAAPLVVSAAEPLTALSGESLAVELPTATRDERLALWRETLGAAAASLNGALPRVCGQFDLSASAIRTAAACAADDAGDGAALWDACRAAARPRMDGLAQRIDAVAGWDDLVLPETQLRILSDVAAHVRQRHRVHDEWGFSGKSPRGLGISALFAGASGTGKTMAAEVLARELRLDLYRIDLASVVSKYIGETEKNLKRLFDAAESGGAILLFDEADALFGKRSEVKDSHDRYANIEVSYLLQRMETYRGLAILTTNLKASLDPAFLRRIRFVVHFPFPDTEQRAAIWRGVFPELTPTAALDYGRLAQLNVAGGHIRNIALAGAFLAADRGERVGMRHLAAAARSEYAKLERPLSEAETRGWV